MVATGNLAFIDKIGCLKHVRTSAESAVADPCQRTHTDT
jgi:hypothetical protein